MSFDLDSVAAAVAAHGQVARVLVAETRGSVPREAGTSMLVWADGQEGTIGGGALEWDAAARARDALSSGKARVDRLALGPSLGQCCGGAVVLVTELWDRPHLDEVAGDVVARGLPGAHRTRPIGVARALARAHDAGTPVRTAIIDDWLVEPIAAPDRSLWIWGAGHVGRALVDVLNPISDIDITWIDTAPERFPAVVPRRITEFVAATPGSAVARAPQNADHLVMTFSHEIDLEICHRLLLHGFRSAGLIGSATKKARFASRLKQLGHDDAGIARITCPIGDPSLGKHPTAIAVGVASAYLKGFAETQSSA